MTHLSRATEPLPRLTTAQTSKLMKQTLQQAFPALPKNFFSVTSETYSGGSSIRVDWTDGPSTRVVDEIVKAFQSTTFDGMTDSTVYLPTSLTLPDGTKARSGAGYVFTQRKLSAKADAVLTAKAKATFGWTDFEVKRGSLENNHGGWPEHSDRVWFSHLTTALSLAPDGTVFWNKAHGAPYL